MLKSKTDYIFIIIFFIVIASFLGMSIVNIIDKKLSNISINVPKIRLPTSEVIVNFEKNGNKYKVKCIKKKSKKKIIDQDQNNEEIESIINDEVQIDTDNINTNLNYSDLESEYAEDLSDDNVNIGDSVTHDRIQENMTGLTAEQFYNKNYINPYVPDFKKITNDKGFKPYNYNEYQ